MKKILLLFIFTLTLSAAALAQNHTYSDTFTITTYYPAPHGVYGTMRLYPSQLPSEGVAPGVLYYNETEDRLKFHNNTTWVNVTGGGGGGYWTQDTNNNIYNTNSGKILMKPQTSATDSSDTVVTKGYLESYTNPMVKVVSGSGATCPAGTEALMRCSGAPTCTWYDADVSLGSWNRVMCGQKLSLDGSLLLSYEQHSSNQCTALGGNVFDTGGVKICKFGSLASPMSSCPGGWTPYLSWRSVAAAEVSITASCDLGGCLRSIIVSCSCIGTRAASLWSNSMGNVASCSCTAYGTNGCRHSSQCQASASSGYGTPYQVGCY